MFQQPSSATARTIAFVATRRDGSKGHLLLSQIPVQMLELSLSLICDTQNVQATRLFHCGSVTLSQNPAREAQFEADARWQQGVLVFV